MEKKSKKRFLGLYFAQNCVKMGQKSLKKNTGAHCIPDVTHREKKKFDPCGVLYAGSSSERIYATSVILK